MSRWTIALVLAQLAALSAGAAASERSLLLTGAERRLLTCAATLADRVDDGVLPTFTPGAAAALPDGPSDRALVAHLSSLIYLGPDEWEFHLNGAAVRPGRLPAGIAAATVGPDRVILVRMDPADGARQIMRLRVGDRRVWPAAAADPSDGAEPSPDRIAARPQSSRDHCP